MRTIFTFLAISLVTVSLTDLAPAARAEGNALPLKFQHVALGNVVRVLSARFHAPVTINAHATAPVTGDFSKLNLRQALIAAAAQAGLDVVPLGTTDAAGYLLRKGNSRIQGLTPSQVNASQARTPGQVANAAALRAALLKQREDLQDQAESLIRETDPTP